MIPKANTRLSVGVRYILFLKYLRRWQALQHLDSIWIVVTTIDHHHTQNII